MPQPNILAYVMLAVWPLVTWQLWRRMDTGRALVWTILGGYLVLPPLAALDLPAVPDLNKVTIPNLAAFAFAVFVLKDRISFLPASVTGKGLMVLFVLSPFATVLTNTHPVHVAGGPLPGTSLYDSFASVANQGIVLLPYFMARRYLAGPEAPRAALAALVAAGLAYSLPMLVEARLSPQINVWVYGFFQHDFFQTIRFGGYRPVVFLPHGLWVAFFAFMAAMAALLPVRERPGTERPKHLMIALYLLAMIIVCKSAGAAIYALASAPLILFAPARIQILVAGGLAGIVILYPMLRGLHLVPVDWVVSVARSFDADRAYSLAFRINNEELLLAHAAEKPLFGWGGYGRNLLHDPVSGKVETIADGAWIIVLGIYGWLGYLAEFGLLVLPLLLLAREVLGRGARRVTLATATLALILAMNLADLIPNATEIPFTWLMAGAVLGQAERLRATRKHEERAPRSVLVHRTVI
ncbi:MAG: hypothetical protein QM656_12205 [Paracoccaceae bacterium]